MHAGKLGQVTIFTKNCVDQYMIFFATVCIGADTDMPGGLHARLCHTFLVYI